MTRRRGCHIRKRCVRAVGRDPLERGPRRRLLPVQHPRDHLARCAPFDKGVTFVCGENGTGKSTLLEAVGYFVRFDTLFNLISATDELEDGQRHYGAMSLYARSHGESIMALITRRFRPEGFYILDEPETGLSQSGQIALLCELARLRDASCQLIIATHSPILLALDGATVYPFDNDVREIDAKDSLEWIMMQRFMDDPDAAMRAFLEP